jgi:predicted enzyme related to lactoylglutathione lyase
MPIRDGAPLGAPCWIDLTTSNLDRAQEFYGTVFGWTFESAGPEYGGYVNASKDGRTVAGLMYNDPQYNSPDGWNNYLHTADVKATLAAATAAGAISCVEPMEVKEKGWMANWFFFLGADDVDKTVQLIKDNGGTVIRDSEDTSGGRLAAVADPTGAGFNLSSLNQ